MVSVKPVAVIIDSELVELPAEARVVAVLTVSVVAAGDRVDVMVVISVVLVLVSVEGPVLVPVPVAMDSMVRPLSMVGVAELMVTKMVVGGTQTAGSVILLLLVVVVVAMPVPETAPVSAVVEPVTTLEEGVGTVAKVGEELTVENVRGADSRLRNELGGVLGAP